MAIAAEISDTKPGPLELHSLEDLEAAIGQKVDEQCAPTVVATLRDQSGHYLSRTVAGWRKIAAGEIEVEGIEEADHA